MKIAVIAANGRSGKIFVEQALKAGHTVRAGVYHTNNLPSHDRLQVVSCDATKPDDLTKLLTGQDAVASLIGHVKGSPPRVQTDAMRTLLEVMRELNLKRLVSLTGTGVRFPGDKITLVDRVLNLGVRLVDPDRIKDGHEYVKILQASDLDWTLIRVLKLQNTAPRPFSLRAHGPTKWYVSREDVAKAILEVLGENSFIRQAPIISKPTEGQKAHGN